MVLVEPVELVELLVVLELGIELRLVLFQLRFDCRSLQQRWIHPRLFHRRIVLLLNFVRSVEVRIIRQPERWVVVERLVGQRFVLEFHLRHRHHLHLD